MVPLAVDQLRDFLPRLLLLNLVQKHGFLGPPRASPLFLPIHPFWLILFRRLLHTFIYHAAAVLMWSLREVGRFLQTEHF